MYYIIELLVFISLLLLICFTFKDQYSQFILVSNRISKNLKMLIQFRNWLMTFQDCT